MHRLSEDSIRSEQFLSRAEVAEFLNVSPSTITRWADSGKLVCFRTLGGHRRYSRESILELVRILSQEEERVKTISFYLPDMYGDHHVNRVRQLLARAEHVQEIWTSAAHRLVRVTYGEELQADEIRAWLTQAGYPPAEPEAQESGPLTQKDPAWAKLDLRITQTY